MSDAIDVDGFRPNVGIILSNAQAHLLLAGRAGQRGWQFPQGGIESDETPMDAMYRELREGDRPRAGRRADPGFDRAVASLPTSPALHAAAARIPSA
jgi:ADP-ribose pyrophosphatase YjhB (NUDIX family)